MNSLLSGPEAVPLASLEWPALGDITRAKARDHGGGVRCPPLRLARTRLVAPCVIALALALPACASAAFTPIGQLPSDDPGLGCPSGLAYYAGSGSLVPTVWVADACANGFSDGQIDGFAPMTADGGGGDYYGAITSFTDAEDNTEYVCEPNGIAVDPATGDAYITNYSGVHSAILEADDNGDVIGEFGGPLPTSSCTSEGPAQLLNPPSNNLRSPNGVAVYNGNLYVADTDGFVEYTPLGFTGTAWSTFGLDSSDVEPSTIAIDPITGNVFVGDESTQSVYEYTSAGQFVRVVASDLSADSFSPVSVAVDPTAQVVYVLAAAGETLYTYDESSAAPLQQSTLPQSPPVSYNDLDGIALDTVAHIAYIADGGSDGNGAAVYAFTYGAPPSCSPGSATSVGPAVAISLSCSDPASTLTYSLATQPSHGALNAFNSATGALTYTPSAGYSGPDSFTFDAKSANGTSQTQTVTITDKVTITAEGCASETLATPYEAATPANLVCSVPGGTYKIVSQPANGTVSGLNTSTGALTYTPNKAFVGVDSFTYSALSPGGQTTAAATITIDVGTQLPPPVQGQSANVFHSWGTVTILLPGQTTPIPLLAGMQVPLGSIIDATNGGVGIFVADNGQIQGADFWAGKFKLTQQGDPQTLLTLLGRKIPKVRCALHPKSYSRTFTLGAVPSSVRDSLAAQIAKKFHEKGKPSRELWGSGHGNFTLVGHGSSAAVRGTEWAIFDYPDGTLTFDFTDSVSVLDFNLQKTVIITAGHFYFAAVGKLPACK